MELHMKQLFAAMLLSLFSAVSMAGADCKEYPEDEWMSFLDMQKKIVNEYGFSIKLFKIDDNCYEIYGWQETADGEQQKIEVYFDPKTGEIVKQKLD